MFVLNELQDLGIIDRIGSRGNLSASQNGIHHHSGLLELAVKKQHSVLKLRTQVRKELLHLRREKELGSGKPVGLRSLQHSKVMVQQNPCVVDCISEEIRARKNHSDFVADIGGIFGDDVSFLQALEDQFEVLDFISA